MGMLFIHITFLPGNRSTSRLSGRRTVCHHVTIERPHLSVVRSPGVARRRLTMTAPPDAGPGNAAASPGGEAGEGIPMKHVRFLASGLLAALLSTWVAAHAPVPEHEIRAEVPALRALHEVIYPLWHTAWPNKDADLMRHLLPRTEELVAAVAAAELPGILRDKSESWQAGIAGLLASLEAYRAAVAGEEEQALLDAVEDLHDRYERLVRTVRPVMKELDAYHVVLYRLYHHIGPGRDLEAFRLAVTELHASCEPLLSAAVPRRFAERQETILAALAELCVATETLAATAPAGDMEALLAGLEVVHDRYQAAEHVFD